MADKQGDFVWYELMTTDADAAQAFYEPLLGWKFAGSDMPGIDYRIGSKDGTQVVGLLELTGDMTKGGARPAWIGYIAADDIHASITDLKDRGGQLHMGPNHLEGVGHMALVADPQGVPFYLMQTEGEGPATSFAKYEPKVGHCAWNELVIDDPDAADAFYTGMFGWQKGEAMDMGEMGVYQMFTQDDYGLGAIMKRPEQMPVSAWAFYFRVPEIEAARSHVESSGGQVVNGPMEIPGGEYVCQGFDPQGAFFSIIGPKGT
ncbi:VOC family protein [Erythrobacter vulgaris]|uniref:VOC family protein n=1 Tax=Qipengyuania vulgaris TaxID=291985 RepID=A0A844XQD9_9SPHN|nr:VOC family protein [Qipengyuania vulgaris]MXO47746.1 VOC family protein [Qipengyuania vulgaris]